MQRTLILLKPETIANNLVGKIITELEKIKNIKFIKFKFFTFNLEQVTNFYKSLSEKEFFPIYSKHMISGPVLSIVLEGQNIIKRVRKVLGDTNPKMASSKSIRGRYAKTIGENLMHASDSLESFFNEYSLIFD